MSFCFAISKSLLLKIPNFGRKFTKINDLDIRIILNVGMTVLFYGGFSKAKSEGNPLFDVSMNIYNEAEVNDFVGLLILGILKTHKLS